jgi:hypothetical protein
LLVGIAVGAILGLERVALLPELLPSLLPELLLLLLPSLLCSFRAVRAMTLLSRAALHALTQSCSPAAVHSPIS